MRKKNVLARNAWIDYQDKLSNIYNNNECSAICKIVFSKVLNIPYEKIILNLDRIIDTAQQKKIEQYLGQLIKKKPVQYILHEALFCNMSIYVNKNVLIPRPESEDFVNIIDTKYENKNLSTLVLDIGTGSGCLAISIAKKYSHWTIDAMDISKSALYVARKNAQKNGLKIKLIQADILNFKQTKKNQSYNIIISNPPYIPLSELQHIDDVVRKNEPHSALFVSDKNPLKFVKAIQNFCKQYLINNGLLIIEIHTPLANEVLDMFNQNPFFYNCYIKKDCFGLDRFLVASKT